MRICSVVVSCLTPVMSLAGTPAPAFPPPTAPTAVSQSPPQTGPPGTLATAFFYWYRYVPDGDGNIDPARSDSFYAFDPAAGRYLYKLGEDFPDTWNGDPAKPYKSIVDYTNPEWYKLEYRDMAAARIDIAAMSAYLKWPPCIYAEGPDPYYAWAGIAPAAEALRQMQAAGEPAPKLALLWETGLLNGYDLTQGFTAAEYSEDCGTGRYTPNAWAAWLQVREFYRRLGATNAERAGVWGTVDGRPLLMAYDRFNTRVTQQFWDWLSGQFEAEFGVRPYIVLSQSWAGGSDGQPIHPDAYYSWNSALFGPTDMSVRLGGDRFINVGPGFDESWFPCRRGNAIRPREDGLRGVENPTGTFYDFSWQTALSMQPKVVFIETWNERYEATGIARSRRYEDFYIRKTGPYADALHAGQTVPQTTVPVYPRPMQYRAPDDPAFAGRRTLRYTAANDSMTVGAPAIFRQRSVTADADGGLAIQRCGEFAGEVVYREPYLLSEPGRAWSYVHARVSDSWGFDLPDDQTVKARITYVDDRSVLPTDPPGTFADLFLEYDSWDPAPNYGEDPSASWPGGHIYKMPNHLESSLTNTVQDSEGQIVYSTRWATIPLGGSPESAEVKTAEWVLPRARFGNRQNDGSDFRINVRIPDRTKYEPLKILSVEVEGPDTISAEYFQRTWGTAARALRIATGLQTLDGADLWRLDEAPGGASQDRIDLLDAAKLVREAAGLDPMGIVPVNY